MKSRFVHIRGQFLKKQNNSYIYIIILFSIFILSVWCKTSIIGTNGIQKQTERLNTQNFDSKNHTPLTSDDPSITITSPAISDVWDPNSLQVITWTSSGISDLVNIDLYIGGNYFSSIQTDVSDGRSGGSYNWVVPVVSSGPEQIYIEDAANSEYK